MGLRCPWASQNRQIRSGTVVRSAADDLLDLSWTLWASGVDSPTLVGRRPRLTG